MAALPNANTLIYTPDRQSFLWSLASFGLAAGS
jgi:hypothetical protein